MVGLFFLRRPKRPPPSPAEPSPLEPEPDPAYAEPPFGEATYAPHPSLALARYVDDTPEGLPGVPDLYAILGVEPLASDETIRYAYRRKAARLHERRWRPDQAVRQLAEVNAAYEILGKPDRRADYDRRRARRIVIERRANGGAGEAATPSGRGLPSGRRHEKRRLRLDTAHGLIEVAVIATAIALALYVGTTMLTTRSPVDLSRVAELGETLGVRQRPRATGAPPPSPTAKPSPSATPASGPADGRDPASDEEPDDGAEPSEADPEDAPDADAGADTTFLLRSMRGSVPMAMMESRFSGSTAWIVDPTPPRRSNASLVARVVRDGWPAAGAPVYAVVHRRDADERWPHGGATPRTGPNGEATIVFNVGDAAPGDVVAVDAIARVAGEQVRLQTTFTAR